MSQRKRKRRLESQHIREGTWFYDSKSGIDLVHEVRDAKGTYLQTVIIPIPARVLRDAAKRFARAP